MCSAIYHVLHRTVEGMLASSLSLFLMLVLRAQVSASCPAQSDRFSTLSESCDLLLSNIPDTYAKVLRIPPAAHGNLCA
jgi:hypothetical protein